MKKALIKHSKFLSLVLRHKPETIGLSLDHEGWVAVDLLLSQMKAHGRVLTQSMLEEVVRTNEKQRFAFSEDGRQIRASQGHSVAVDLGIEPSAPPEVLYHGTASRFLGSIMEQGLVRGERQHVHLSADEVTAHKVGQRHGSPIILEVAAGAMQKDGQLFYLSENGVWLTDAVARQYLQCKGGNSG